VPKVYRKEPSQKREKIGGLGSGGIFPAKVKFSYSLKIYNLSGS